jgi:F-type H+-transporting ATPase subunit b
MRRYLSSLVLVAALSAPSLGALAEEPPVSGEGAEGASEEAGIVNWWSWDYGANAKDPAHKGWPPPFGFALVNFGIFLAVMGKLFGKSLGQFVRDRHDKIKLDLDEAAKLRDGAQAMLLEYQKKVENVDGEIEELLTTIRKEAEAEKLRLIAAAEEQARRLKSDAERQITAEIDRARLELRRGVIEAAIAAAEELLQKQIGADDQRKIAERYVAGIEQTRSS